MAFDARLAAQSPAEFVDHSLADELQLGHVVVGYDFTFGKARAGDTGMLRELCGKRDIGVTVVAAQQDGEVYSSTRIRTLLEAGNIAEANPLHGRPWENVAAVAHGAKRAREPPGRAPGWERRG